MLFQQSHCQNTNDKSAHHGGYDALSILHAAADPRAKALITGCSIDSVMRASVLGNIGQQFHPEIRDDQHRSEEHTSELQSLMRNSYSVFCLTKNTITLQYHTD